MHEQTRLFLHPPPPCLFSVFLPPSTCCPSVLSLALQVVALRLAPLPAIVAGKRLPVFVHAPAVAPPPAFGWTALQNKEEGEELALLEQEGLHTQLAPAWKNITFIFSFESAGRERTGKKQRTYHFETHCENRLAFPRWGITLTQLFSTQASTWLL